MQKLYIAKLLAHTAATYALTYFIVLLHMMLNNDTFPTGHAFAWALLVVFAILLKWLEKAIFKDGITAKKWLKDGDVIIDGHFVPAGNWASGRSITFLLMASGTTLVAYTGGGFTWVGGMLVIHVCYAAACYMDHMESIYNRLEEITEGKRLTSGQLLRELEDGTSEIEVRIVGSDDTVWLPNTLTRRMKLLEYKHFLIGVEDEAPAKPPVHSAMVD